MRLRTRSSMRLPAGSTIGRIVIWPAAREMTGGDMRRPLVRQTAMTVMTFGRCVVMRPEHGFRLGFR